MHKLKYLTFSIVLVMSLSLAGLAFGMSPRSPAAFSPPLGAAEGFSALAHTTVTNTGPTITSGAVGVSTGTSITGFPPGIAGGGTHSNDASAIAAQAANLVAFGALDQVCDITYPGVQDLTLVSPLGPGVYCADAFLLTGNLTLSGSSGVWIFKSAATLTTSANSSVTGDDPCNVWWRLVSSVSIIAPGTKFIGNILGLTSIALQTGASLNGRALVQTGAVTLDSNTITGCTAQSTATATTSPAATLPATQTAIAATQTAIVATPLPATQTAIVATQTAIAATQTEIAATPLPATRTAIAATPLPATRTAIAATRTVIVATQTAIAATQTAIAATPLPATRTAIAATRTVIAATQTAIAATQTAIAATPLPATRTAIAATPLPATRTAIVMKPTSTMTPQPTPTLLPVVTGLPGTGGGPIRNEDFPWSLVIAGSFSAIALLLGVRAYRSIYRPKQ
jgi:hypothetical protein